MGRCQDRLLRLLNHNLQPTSIGQPGISHAMLTRALGIGFRYPVEGTVSVLDVEIFLPHRYSNSEFVSKGVR